MKCDLCNTENGVPMQITGHDANDYLACLACLMKIADDKPLTHGMYAKPKEPETWTCWLCERRIDEGLPKYDDGVYHTDKAWCATCASHVAPLKARDLKAGMFKTGWPKKEPETPCVGGCGATFKDLGAALGGAVPLRTGKLLCEACWTHLLNSSWTSNESKRDARIRSLEKEVEHQRSLNVVHKGWLMDVAKALEMPTEALLYADVVECAAKQRAELERIRDKCEEARDAALDYRMAISAIKTVLANLHEEPRT